MDTTTKEIAVTGILESTRLLPLLAAILLATSACDNPQRDGRADVGQPKAPATDQTATGAAPPASAGGTASARGEAGARGFDIGSVAVSNEPLGDFPYFTLPAGYRPPNRPIPVRDFDRVALWTGDRLEWVEGRIFESQVHAETGKGYSRLEVLRNLEHQARQAGGTRVTDSSVPGEIVKAWDAGQAYSKGRGDIYNNPVVTWLVRRADRNIWVHFVSNNSSGSLMVVESAPFQATSALLPRSELKKQLDSAGRVALQVNFATDRAEILPESQPQIEQVLALLAGDPSLELSVEGHTDDTGDAARNRRLSEARAQAVVAALTGKGIAGSRLAAAGFGQDRPVTDNATEEGRARNRRVELVKRL